MKTFSHSLLVLGLIFFLHANASGPDEPTSPVPMTYFDTLGLRWHKYSELWALRQNLEKVRNKYSSILDSFKIAELIATGEGWKRGRFYDGFGNELGRYQDSWLERGASRSFKARISVNPGVEASLQDSKRASEKSGMFSLLAVIPMTFAGLAGMVWAVDALFNHPRETHAEYYALGGAVVGFSLWAGAISFGMQSDDHFRKAIFKYNISIIFPDGGIE